MSASKYLLPVVMTVSLFLGACASSKDQSAASGQADQPDQISSPYTDNIGGATNEVSGGAGYDAAVAAERALSTNIVYFDFDQSTVKAEYQSVIDNFARFLSANPSVKVRLEGHADERGTREYNIGLGEHRANAVQSALRAQGVSAAQISVISYGEERPAAQGHDESAYGQNRRVQIIRQ
jgi:peptidoglycan-associated lipoprotein